MNARWATERPFKLLGNKSTEVFKGVLMILNTITSGAKRISKFTGDNTPVSYVMPCAKIQVSSGIFSSQDHALCNIQGHSPWRSNKNSRKISLLSSIHMQRKNSSFSLSRKIQNENGFIYRIHHELGEVNQGMYVTASDVDAVPLTG